MIRLRCSSGRSVHSMQCMTPIREKNIEKAKMFNPLGSVTNTSIQFEGAGERYTQRLEAARQRKQYTGEEDAPYTFDRLYPIFLEYALYYYSGQLTNALYRKGQILNDHKALELFQSMYDDVDLVPSQEDTKRFIYEWKRDMGRDL